MFESSGYRTRIHRTCSNLLVTEPVSMGSVRIFRLQNPYPWNIFESSGYNTRINGNCFNLQVTVPVSIEPQIQLQYRIIHWPQYKKIDVCHKENITRGNERARHYIQLYIQTDITKAYLSKQSISFAPCRVSHANIDLWLVPFTVFDLKLNSNF